ncbi:MAG: hypothetical protein MJZ57_06845 [Bacteroidales bacterium]|nr:hypothetical protein [Bacteroidales bacterium]
MNDYIKDSMSDDEIRVLGGVQESSRASARSMSGSSHPIRKYVLVGLAVIGIVGLIVLLSFLLGKRNTQQLEAKMKLSEKTSAVSERTANLKSSSNSNAYLVFKDTVINDIPMRMIFPENCKMKLYVGKLPQHDDVLLALPAADVRSDKDAPTGAFVVDGELVSKGQSKYGFCAIIGDEITIGRQLETKLFERSIENNGSFFRQYSLVSDGKLIDIPPKGKSLRRALCYANGEIVVVLTQDRESFHDFSQALVDLGVKEALSLPGADAAIHYVDTTGNSVTQGQTIKDKPKSENYLIWSKL